jgi:4-hydroxybenzoate polyprenyltransferase
MNPIIAFTKLIRLPNLLIIVLTQYAIRYGIIYPIIHSVSDDVEVKLQMSNLDFFLLSLSTVMIAAAGYIINDYFDVKVDRVNRPDKIIVGKYIRRRVAMGAHFVINTIAIIIAGYLAYKVGNWQLIFIQIITAGALWYYSTLFKKQVLVGNVIVALMAALVPFIVGLYELTLQHANLDSTVNSLLFFLEAETPFEEVEFIMLVLLRNVMLWVLGFSFFAFMSTVVREIIKDIEDYEGDKKYFSNTLAVIYGKSKAKIAAQGFAVIMIGLIGYLQYIQLQAKDMASFMYFLFAVQAPLVYVIYQLKLAKEKTDYSKLSKTMKLIMLMGIAYTAFFYYSTTNL